MFSLDVFCKTSTDRFVNSDMTLRMQYISETDHMHVGVALRIRKIYHYCDYLHKYYNR